VARQPVPTVAKTIQFASWVSFVGTRQTVASPEAKASSTGSVSARKEPATWPATPNKVAHRFARPDRVRSTVRCGGDPHRTRHWLHRFLSWCIDSKIPELVTPAGTVDVWWPAIHAFVLLGSPIARTEGYRLVKTVKRAACGFRTREHSDRRIRFHCTRTERAAATQTLC